MKIGLFADPHYSTETAIMNRRPSLSYNKIRIIMDEFLAQKVEMIICLGDLINAEPNVEQNIKNLNEISLLIKSYKIPFHCLIGNHDVQAFSSKDFEKISSFTAPPYYTDINNMRFIFLDANFTDDEVAYTQEKNPWKNSYIPQNQLNWLKQALDTAETACICSHQNLDDRDNPHVIRNASVLRKIMEESNKVSYVFSGHFHDGLETTINNIKYLTPRALCIEEEINYSIIEI